MKITNALKVIQLNIEAEINGYNGVQTTTLSGKPGIGKTVMTRELAKEMGLEFYHVSAPEISIEQLTGLPEFNDVPKGFEKYAVSGNPMAKGTAWSCPEIIANANSKATSNGKGCILMLDDLHETPLSTIPYFYQLLNEKKVSGWALDENVFIVAAMNDSDSANFDGLPSPIINRMSMIKTEFDATDFLDGYGVKFNYLIRSFLKSNSQFLNEEESTEVAFGTPRSWTQLNNSFEYMLNADKDFAIENVKEISNGSISHKASLELTKHITYLDKLNLNKYVEDKELVNVSELDALDQVLMGYIINFIDSIEDGAYLTDLLKTNIENKSFIGFAGSELYLKYMNMVNENTAIPLGLRLFIEKGLEVEEFDIENYGKVSKKDLKVIEKYELSDEDRNNFLQGILPYM